MLLPIQKQHYQILGEHIHYFDGALELEVHNTSTDHSITASILVTSTAATKYELSELPGCIPLIKADIADVHSNRTNK